MSVAAHSLTGLWSGYYAYAGGWEPPVNFTATLNDDGGILGGWISEPDSITGTAQRLSAFVSGMRNGSSVTFSKTYDGDGPLAHRVDYVGGVSSDGGTISGTWSLPGATGTFVMTRPLAEESEIEIADRIDLLDLLT
jgi:hypothetical protein